MKNKKILYKVSNFIIIYFIQIMKNCKESSHILSINEKQEPNPQNYGNLYLSGVGVLNNPDDMKNKRIDCVLTVIDQWAYKHFKVGEKINHLQINNHKWINVIDEEDQNIYQHLHEGIQFIGSNIKKTNVLVHCQMGISRSATMVIAFLMKELGMDLEKAKGHVKDRRKIIQPNHKFIKDLKRLQEDLKNKLQS